MLPINGLHGLQPGAHGHPRGDDGGSTVSGALKLSSALPTVRCATCDSELALDELADHACDPIPITITIPITPNTTLSYSPPPSVPSVPSVPSIPASPMMHPRALMPGDLRPVMNRSPSPFYQNQFIDQNQRLPPRGFPQQRLPPQQPPWEPPVQQQQMPQRRAPLPSSSPSQGPDTKSGGEAGMAGVGRRGFAMAAAATMFPPSVTQAYNNQTPVRIDPGRRFNVPQYLGINGGGRGVCSPSLLPLTLSVGR